jgi:LPS sulfotransferase NodH
MGSRFIIVAAPRTGTNALLERLRAQPDVWCHGELLQYTRCPIRPNDGTTSGDLSALKKELLALRAVDADAFFERVFALSNGRTHVGFKVLAGDSQDRDLNQKALEDRSLKKIVLFRENVLAVYASQLAAAQTGAWNPTQMAKTERPKVAFSREQFHAFREKYAAAYRNFYGTLLATGQAHFSLRHDELNDPWCLSRVLQFLGANEAVAPFAMPEVRGSSDILSRFLNPEVAQDCLRENGLMHWAYEGDVSLAPLTA